jgi:hypothetical protein
VVENIRVYILDSRQVLYAGQWEQERFILHLMSTLHSPIATSPIRVQYLRQQDRNKPQAVDPGRFQLRVLRRRVPDESVATDPRPDENGRRRRGALLAPY